MRKYKLSRDILYAIMVGNRLTRVVCIAHSRQKSPKGGQGTVTKCAFFNLKITVIQ